MDSRLPLWGDAGSSALLARVREYLGMDVACVLGLEDGTTLRVDQTTGDLPDASLAVGDETSWEGSLSQHVAHDGYGFVGDVTRDPRTRDLRRAETLGVGSYVGVPILLRDGTQYGVLCCLSSRSGVSPPGRGGEVLMGFVAGLIADLVDRRLGGLAQREHEREMVRGLLAAGGPDVVFQGVFDLGDLRLDGFEALSRFPSGWGPPDRGFAVAAEVGLGLELELAAVRNALETLRRCGAEHLSLGVNVSPATFVSERLLELVDDERPTHLVVELTEHEPIKGYDGIRAARSALRERGVRVAADDAGAGYAGLRHLVELQPDCIKLDRSIVANIDRDGSRKSIAEAMARFAHDQDAIIIVEGIETEGELVCCMDDLDVSLAQGFLLHRPEKPWPGIADDLKPPVLGLAP